MIAEHVDVAEIGEVVLPDFAGMIAPVIRGQRSQSEPRPGPVETDRLFDPAGLVEPHRSESIQPDPDQTAFDPAPERGVANGPHHADDPSSTGDPPNGIRRMPVENHEASEPTPGLFEDRMSEDAADAEAEHDQRLVVSKPLLAFDLEHRVRDLGDPLGTPA